MTGSALLWLSFTGSVKLMAPVGAMESSHVLAPSLQHSAWTELPEMEKPLKNEKS